MSFFNLPLPPQVTPGTPCKTITVWKTGNFLPSTLGDFFTLDPFPLVMQVTVTAPRRDNLAFPQDVKPPQLLGFYGFSSLNRRSSTGRNHVKRTEETASSEYLPPCLPSPPHSLSRYIFPKGPLWKQGTGVQKRVPFHYEFRHVLLSPFSLLFP